MSNFIKGLFLVLTVVSIQGCGNKSNTEDAIAINNNNGQLHTIGINNSNCFNRNDCKSSILGASVSNDYVREYPRASNGYYVDRSNSYSNGLCGCPAGFVPANDSGSVLCVKVNGFSQKKKFKSYNLSYASSNVDSSYDNQSVSSYLGGSKHYSKRDDDHGNRYKNDYRHEGRQDYRRHDEDRRTHRTDKFGKAIALGVGVIGVVASVIDGNRLYDAPYYQTSERAYGDDGSYNERACNGVPKVEGYSEGISTEKIRYSERVQEVVVEQTEIKTPVCAQQVIETCSQATSCGGNYSCQMYPQQNYGLCGSDY